MSWLLTYGEEHGHFSWGRDGKLEGNDDGITSGWVFHGGNADCGNVDGSDVSGGLDSDCYWKNISEVSDCGGLWLLEVDDVVSGRDVGAEVELGWLGEGIEVVEVDDGWREGESAIIDGSLYF